MEYMNHKSELSTLGSCRGQLTCLVIASLVLSWIPPALATDETRPYAISTRIGDEIDNEERDYFGLFPGLDGFILAHTYKTRDREILIHIERQHSGAHADSMVTLRRDAAKELKAYIEEFEAIARDEASVEWTSIYDLAEPPEIDLGERGKQTSVVIENGQEISGELIFASNDVLLIWECETPFCWYSTPRCTEVISPSEIVEIKVSTGTGFWRAMGGGALGGVALGLFLVDKADCEDPDSEDCTNDMEAKHYLIFSGILGGIGLVAGTIYGAVRGSEDHYDVLCDSSEYEKNLKDIKSKAYFREISPPEFREYYDPDEQR